MTLMHVTKSRGERPPLGDWSSISVYLKQKKDLIFAKNLSHASEMASARQAAALLLRVSVNVYHWAR